MPGFQVTLLLADAVQAVDNKLYILGGGWSVTGPVIGPSAIAVSIKVPWDQANQPHNFTLKLLDSDGQPVVIDTPIGDQSIEVLNQFEVGRPPGTPQGVPLEMALAFNFGPLPLVPGRYDWRAALNEEEREDWSLPFSVRAA